MLQLIADAPGDQTSNYLVPFVFPPVLLTVLFRFMVCRLCFFFFFLIQVFSTDTKTSDVIVEVPSHHFVLRYLFTCILEAGKDGGRKERSTVTHVGLI